MDARILYTRALLADLAYVSFQDFSNNDVVIRNANNEGRIGRSLGTYFFTELGWSIASYHPNDISGFSATLFANGTEKVLAIRGTEIGGPLNTYQDLLKTDLAEIGILGVAATQAVALFNYVQRLIAPAGASNVVQLALHKSDLPPPGGTVFIDQGELAADRYLWLEASHSGTGLGVLRPGDHVTVTGHSLGGHLAALALRLFPSLFSEAFTFNAPGFDPPLTSSRLTDQFVGLIAAFAPAAPATSFESIADRIHTLQSESSAPGDDSELVSADLTGLPPSSRTAGCGCGPRPTRSSPLAPRPRRRRTARRTGR